MSLFSIITSPLGLPIDNALIEWLILFIVEMIAGRMAYSATNGGPLGHEKWWLAKLFFFVAVWAILYVIIWLAKLVINNWVVIVCCLAGLLAAGVVTWLIVLKRKKSMTQDNEV